MSITRYYQEHSIRKAEEQSIRTQWSIKPHSNTMPCWFRNESIPGNAGLENLNLSDQGEKLTPVTIKANPFGVGYPYL